MILRSWRQNYVESNFSGLSFASTYQQGDHRYFICNANAKYNSECYCGTGVGTSLEEGAANAKRDLLKTIHAQANPILQTSTIEGEPADKSCYNGGGKKPISGKQLDLIKNLGEQHSQNPEKIARAKYGKPLGELCGMEASEMIQNLMGITL